METRGVLEASYPVRLSPPDIADHQIGTTGVDYVHTFDSGRSGPHAMINALNHGNELCGAIVVDGLLREGLRPLRGKLTLSFANVAAYQSFDPSRPTLSRYVDEDFNRLWDFDTLDGPRHSTELRRARALRPVLHQVDYLLDIHSMQTEAPALALCGCWPKGRALAAGVGTPAYAIADDGHAAGARMRDYGGFGDADSPKNALLVECGQHWHPASVAVARETTLRFLSHLAMLPPNFAAELSHDGNRAAQRFIQVTHTVTAKSRAFRFLEPYDGLERIPKAGTVLGYDGAMALETPYDDCVLVMPSHGVLPGQTAVRLGRYDD